MAVLQDAPSVVFQTLIDQDNRQDSSSLLVLSFALSTSAALSASLSSTCDGVSTTSPRVRALIRYFDYTPVKVSEEGWGCLGAPERR